MTDQDLAVRAVSRAESLRGTHAHNPLYRKLLPSIAIATGVTALIIGGTALAKQQCSTSAGSGGFWSWRMIDGRKCWYEGKPMISRDLLEWSAETKAGARPVETKVSARPASTEPSARPASDDNEDMADARPAMRRKPVEVRRNAVDERRDPMDAQARATEESGTFEALWRLRIQN